MYFRRGKVTRGAISIQVRSLAGTRSCHHDRVSPTTEWIGALYDRMKWCRLGCLVGNKLIRCHPTQLRRCSEREVPIASLKGLVQISMPTIVTELTIALSPGQFEDLSTKLPTRDDLRVGEVDLEEPPTGHSHPEFTQVATAAPTL